jgi:phage-related protein/SLT domain-containing protein
MSNIIREETVAIKFKIDDSPLKSLTKNLNALKGTVDSTFKGSSFEGLKNSISGVDNSLSKLKGTIKNSGLNKLKSDIEAGGAAISVAKDKINKFNSTLKNITTHPLKTLDKEILSIQMSTGRAITEFKNLAKTKVDNLKNNLSNIKKVLTEGETGAKGFSNAIKNIGKISVSKLVTGFTNIKNKLTLNKSEGSSFLQVLKNIGSASLEKLKSGFNGLKSVISTVKNSVQNLGSQISSAANSITSKIFTIKNAIMGLAVGTIGKSALSVVGDRQDITSQFEVLLGSAEAAQKRVEELTTFAGQTPFTRDEIFSASKQLQVFTGEALSTGDSLKVIGDVAAGTGQSFEDVALWTGRLYDAMKSGNAVGEMTSRLQEMGAISGEDRTKIEALAEAGGDITKNWAEVEKIFSKYNGTMEKMSNNLNNMLLSLKSFATNNILLPLGEGIAKGLQPAIEKFREFRKKNSKAIEDMGTVLKNFAEKICIPLFTKIESGAEKLILAIASLKNGFSGFWNSGSKLATVLEPIKPIFDFIVNNKDMVITALQGIGAVLGTILVANKIMAVAKALSFLASPIGILGATVTILFMIFKNGAEPVMSFFQNLGGLVQAAIPKITNAITNVFNSLMTVIPQVLPILTQIITDLINSLTLMLPSIVDMGLNLILALIDGIISAIPVLLQSLPTIVQNLINGLMTAIPKIINAGIKFINALIQGIQQNLPLIVESALKIIQSLINGITQNIPVIVQSAIKLMQNFIKGLKETLPQIIQAAIELIKGLLQGLLQSLPTIVQAGIQLVLALLQGILDRLSVIIQGAIQLIMGLVQGLIENLPLIIKTGIEIIVALAIGLIKAIPKLIAAIPTIFGSFIKGIFSINWLELGWEIIKAIANGIWEGIKSLGSSIWNGIKSLFTGDSGEAESEGEKTGQSYTTGIESGINTASTANLGLDTANSFASGLTSGTETVTAAAQGLTSETQNAMSIAAQGSTKSAEEVATQITEQFNKVTESISSLPEKIQGVLTPIETVVTKLTEIPEKFATAFSTLPENVGNIETAASKLKTALEPLPAAIEPAIPALTNLQNVIVPLAQTFPQVGEAAQNLLTAIKGITESFASLATSTKTVSDAFSVIPEKINAIIPLCQPLVVAIQPLVEKFLELSPKITEVANKFTELATALQTSSDSVTIINNSFKAIAESMKTISEGITNFKTKLDEIPGASQKAATAADTFIDAFKPIPDQFNKIMTEINKIMDDNISEMIDKVSKLPQKMADGIKAGGDSLKNSLVSIWQEAAKAMAAPVNKIIDGANWILKQFDADKQIASWTPYARGTDGHKGGNALVNDGRGAELIQMPNGRLFIPQGRNVFLPNAPKGMKVLPAEQTAQLLGKKSPAFRYANGTGDIDIWNFIDDSKGLVDAVSDKFVSYDGLSGFALNAGKGMVNMIKGAMSSWTKKLFDEFGAKSLADYVASAGVEQWKSTVIRALKMEGQYSEANVQRTLYQMQTESGGNPRAINLWDSNAKAGIPSKGLMQVIDPTFQSYARPGFNSNIYDPLSNILASIRYAVSRYGSLGKAYQGHGYSNGVGTLDLAAYTPENSGDTVINNRNKETIENTTYSPVFNLTISGTTDDRVQARKVQRWVKEAMNDMYESMNRKNRQIVRV